MGSVWLAEQITPVKRLVAVKLVKAGMDSRQVLARFEAERQALALMDHPNIARVLDGGAAPDGRPYFVMELVKGVPITDYCDAQRLGLPDRLRLFADVCRAVQHAHQKGVIHRDLKPSNVLVAPYDGTPVIKVIDFGIAKATGQALTEKTLLTKLGTVIGTPEYMSPEQAELNNADIDTRSDVFGLGVLLYELLTGTTPLTRARVREAALLEVLRLVREEEPPRPSTRLSSTAELPSIAAVRGTEPARLPRQVRGELDWIVMKCLEKDRNRRYETANGLVMDLQRYLSDETVKACPPSARYRFWKYARRNKVALTTAAVVALALVAGTAVSTWQAVRARRAERLAGQRLRAEQRARADAETARGQALANHGKARDAVDRLLIRVGEVDLSEVPQMEQVRRRLLEDALEINQGFLTAGSSDQELKLEAARVHLRVGSIDQKVGRNAEAERAYLAEIELLKTLARSAPGDPRPRMELVWAYIGLGYVPQAGDTSGLKCVENRRRAVALVDQLVKEHPTDRKLIPLRTESYFCLGHTVLYKLRQPKEGEAILRQALEIARDGGDWYFTGRSAQTLGGICMQARRFDEAESFLRTAIQAIEKSGTTRNHRRSLGLARVTLGQTLTGLRRFEEADEQYVRALDLFSALARDYPDVTDHPGYVAAAAFLHGNFLKDRGQTEEAVIAFRRALEADLRSVAMTPSTVSAHDGLRMHYKSLDGLLGKANRAAERQQIARDVVTLYESLLAKDPGNPLLRQRRDGFNAFVETADANALLARARADFDRKDCDSAIAGVTRVVEIQPENGPAWHLRGHAFSRKGEYSRALADYTRAVELQPNSSWHLGDRGNTQLRLGRYAEAVADLSEALRLSQEANTPLTWLLRVRADANAKLERWEQAVADHLRAIEIEPKYAPSRLDRALCLIRLGRYAEARDDYQAALELQPGNPTALNDLAWLLAACPGPGLRDPARAVELATKAVANEPKKATAWNTLGVARFRSGDWPGAIEALMKSEELSPGKALGFNGLFLAMAHQQLGRKDEARRWYDRAVAWTEKQAPKDEDLIRFRAEAEDLLAISPPPRLEAVGAPGR